MNEHLLAQQASEFYTALAEHYELMALPNSLKPSSQKHGKLEFVIVAPRDPSQDPEQKAYSKVINNIGKIAEESFGAKPEDIWVGAGEEQNALNAEYWELVVDIPYVYEGF